MMHLRAHPKSVLILAMVLLIALVLDAASGMHTRDWIGAGALAALFLAVFD